MHQANVVATCSGNESTIFDIESDNGSDHRAAGVIVASKHALSAASRASYCYASVNFADTRIVEIIVPISFLRCCGNHDDPTSMTRFFYEIA